MSSNIVFDKENILSSYVKETINFWLGKFQKNHKRSVVLVFLHIVQDVNGGFLSDELIIAVADYLLISKIFVYEVATFYSMYNLKHLIKNRVCICTSLTCSLYGSVILVEEIKRRYNLDSDGVSANRNFYLLDVECLALCDRVPFIQIGKLYYFKFTKEMVFEILDKLE